MDICMPSKYMDAGVQGASLETTIRRTRAGYPGRLLVTAVLGKVLGNE